jgi:hypothetical protein
MSFAITKIWNNAIALKDDTMKEELWGESMK